jgi:acetyltransferase-like isoleucine patch superfamily enzyme
MFDKDLPHVSIARSLYLSLRFGGKIIILRGTRLRLDRGAKIQVPRECRLVIGRHHANGAPASLEMRRNARLTIRGRGRVPISRGARIMIYEGAQLDIGAETVINFNATITCLRRISIGLGSGIGWNCNLLDGNAHPLTVDGAPRPVHTPIQIGDRVWVGTGVTVIGATIGDGTVIGAGSVVASDVPGGVLVVGNPARVVSKCVSHELLRALP